MNSACGTMRIVLGDQLSSSLASLNGLDKANDIVFLAEVREECTYVRHHKKKLVLVLSAMRHFAAALRADGITVDYVTLLTPGNTHTLTGEMRRAVGRHRPARVLVTAPAEFRLMEQMRRWQDDTGIATELLEDDRYLCTQSEFRHWARGKRQLRLEFFYRDMRRRYGLLLEAEAPAGGRWNYDTENRRRLPVGVSAPPVPAFPPDATTREVMALVDAAFPTHFGDTEGFSLPVTAADARAAFAGFLRDRLASFGDWQDAMRTGDSVLFHALISPMLNLGLLDPLTVCRMAEQAWREGDVPLNSAEGFIRQVLGWREFVRGIYWREMPEYGTSNALDATRALPQFYWSGETHMNCLAQAVRDTWRHAYAHHIQRLMITGNFALLAGLDPDQVDEWYMIVYADAYQWVEMPNTRGMALFADGGIVGSKPYAASGAYINRMSDYCAACTYDVRSATDENSCPFNALYWDFVARHSARFAGNTRMAMPLRNWERMTPARRAALRTRAATLLARIETGDPI